MAQHPGPSPPVLPCPLDQPAGMSLPDAAAALVLIVIADADLREFVGSIVTQMELASTLAATWREAIMATTEPPACIVADLDDVGDMLAGVAVFQKSWDEVPLIVLSRKPNVGEQAEDLGAVAGIRKPINVGALMQAIRRAVGKDGSRLP